jgi:YegS/Rv2252/BmrU family lipid kinase
MSRYKIIANPVSGSGAGARAIPKIEDLFKLYELDFHLVKTEYRGHGIELAKAACEDGYDVVVASGGDGTVNEVINGLMQSKPKENVVPTFAILGAGRGNDLAYSINVPSDLEDAIKTLSDDHRQTIDIGCVRGGKFPEGRFFGNCVGVGFDAVTTIEVSKMPRLGGFLSFLIAVLKTIFLYYKGPLIQIKFDDQELTQHCLMVSVMNGQRLGGGFWTAPDAQLTDGLFDLCIAEEVPRRRIFTLIPYFLKGTQGTQDEITMGRGRRIVIRALDGVLPAQTDGEILCVDGDRLEIEILPQQLDVVTRSK